MTLFHTTLDSGDGVLSAVAWRNRALPGASLTKRTVLVMFAMALAVGVTSAPAQASDQRRCVSQREYRDVQVSDDGGVGWRQARVADHFDIHGTQIRFLNRDGQVDTVWKYRKCSAWGPGGSYAAVWYDNYSSSPPDHYMRAYEKAPNRPYALGADFFSEWS